MDLRESTQVSLTQELELVVYQLYPMPLTQRMQILSVMITVENQEIMSNAQSANFTGKAAASMVFQEIRMVHAISATQSPVISFLPMGPTNGEAVLREISVLVSTHRCATGPSRSAFVPDATANLCILKEQNATKSKQTKPLPLLKD